MVAPFELDDETPVAPGTILAPVIAAVHRRPDIYPEPDRFLPDRFVGIRPGTYTWVPSGGGDRRCLGSAFAMFGPHGGLGSSRG
ncbi:cytochrome P450 [Paraconexibacter antarcticus]|uniref:Cytochrome P450 n=1 Tax=Paraconexibacter antarcticus TaxID=2949664 RepID=A0ABY5DZB4_9ACTN|nr:cytochrome P450 [Paraconexibacter antarcticus]